LWACRIQNFSKLQGASAFFQCGCSETSKGISLHGPSLTAPRSSQIHIEAHAKIKCLYSSTRLVNTTTPRAGRSSLCRVEPGVQAAEWANNGHSHGPGSTAKIPPPERKRITRSFDKHAAPFQILRILPPAKWRDGIWARTITFTAEKLRPANVHRHSRDDSLERGHRRAAAGRESSAAAAL